MTTILKRWTEEKANMKKGTWTTTDSLDYLEVCAKEIIDLLYELEPVVYNYQNQEFDDTKLAMARVDMRNCIEEVKALRSQVK